MPDKKEEQEQWAAREAARLSESSKKQEESRKLLEFILKEAKGDAQKPDAQPETEAEGQPIGLSSQEKDGRQIGFPDILQKVSEDKRIIPEQKVVKQETIRPPNPLDNTNDLFKNNKEQEVFEESKGLNLADVVSAMSQNPVTQDDAVAIAHEEIPRELVNLGKTTPVGDVLRIGGSTSGNAEAYWGKAVTAITNGVKYLFGAVKFIKGTYTTLTLDSTASPNTIKIDVDKTSLNIPVLPTNIVNTVTASGGGITSSPTTGDVIVKNTGVKSIVQGTGIILDEPTGDVTIDADVDDTVAGTEPATSMYALTNLNFVAEADGTHAWFAGCRVRTKALTVAGWQDMGVISGTGGVSGVTSIWTDGDVAGTAGDIGITGGLGISTYWSGYWLVIRNTGIVTVNGSGADVNGNVTIATPSGIDDEVEVVTNVYWDEASHSLKKSTNTLHFTAGVLVLREENSDETITTAEECD